MRAADKRTVGLPAEQTGYIDKLVRSRAYASASEVVRAGLRALKERDALTECWLREDVAPVYASVEADPTRVIPARQVFVAFRAHHAAHPKRTKRGSYRRIQRRRKPIFLSCTISSPTRPVHASLDYVTRIGNYCLGLATTPKRGTRRDDISPRPSCCRFRAPRRNRLPGAYAHRNDPAHPLRGA